MDSGGIAVGRSDHGQTFGLSRAVDAAAELVRLVKDRIVVEAAADQQTADLCLKFDAGIRLEVLNDSSGFEGWILNGADGRFIVAQGGGRIVER